MQGEMLATSPPAKATAYNLYKYGFDLTGGSLVVVGVRREEIVRRYAALMLFFLAIGRVSRKVCIGVLP